MKANKMKAMVATAYGNHEVLQLLEVDRPFVNADEILVKVVASSSTTADSMMLTGKPYFGRLFTGLRRPKHSIPGTGFSGIVIEIGSSVTKFNIGDEVFGGTTLDFSANAEYMAVSESGVVLHKPESLSFEDAAPICDGHLTSIIFLKEVGNLKIGQKVLINGASGSLGTAAIQIAKFMGAEVTGVCSTSNVGLVKFLGADYVVDYKKEDFTQLDKQYDLIYDTIGKSSFKKAKKVLSENGQFVSPVLGLSIIMQMMRTSILGDKKAKFAATGLKAEDELKVLLQELVEMFKMGKLKTIIDRQYPLEKLAQAQQYVSTGRKKGNVVIINQF